MSVTKKKSQPEKLRALIVTNMYPTPERPGHGPFVRHQFEALQENPDVQVELFRFDPGLANYPKAAFQLRRHFKGRKFDIVHAHFGLVAWPALLARLGPVVVSLHGNDVLVPRSRFVTRTAIPFVALAAPVSKSLAEFVPMSKHTPSEILPCGIDTKRFKPIPRAEARKQLGLDPDSQYVLFPHHPSRPLKRYDRAQAVASGANLLTLGEVPFDKVPLYINAANAVIIPSQLEGFGLAALEALACNVPVLATPTGNHPAALAGIEGTLCAEWDPAVWKAALRPHLSAKDPRVDGSARAEEFSARRMAAQLVDAWRTVISNQ